MNPRRITAQGQPLLFVDAAGSDFEIGKALGAATAGDIAWMWEHYFLRHADERFGTPAHQMPSTYAWLRKNLERVCPWMAEQIEGLAAGSGLAVEQLVLLNHYGLLWGANGLGCSSLALRASDCGPILGQNLDIGAEEFYFVTRLAPDRGHATLSDAMCAMCWSPTGINDAGLVVGSSNLAREPATVAKPLEHGVPNTHIPRMVLRDCANTAEAIEFIQRLPPVCPPTSGYQLNLLDASGAMAVVDITGDRKLVRQCRPGIGFTTNCSLDPEFERWRAPGAITPGSRDAHARARRIETELAALDGQRPSVQWLKSLLRGTDGDGALCRDGRGPRQSFSRLSLVYYPQQRAMEITNGLPSRQPYQTFAFEPRYDLSKT